MSKGESKEYRTRLKEITSVLHKYGITRGITPQKLRMILEDLGPTYIKIGQIMSLHSDILPKRYCDELMCLRSEVTPMEFPEVKEVIEHICIYFRYTTGISIHCTGPQSRTAQR